MKKSENKNKLREGNSHFELDFNLKSSFMHVQGRYSDFSPVTSPSHSAVADQWIYEDRLIRVTAADTVSDSHRIPYYRFVNYYNRT